MTIVTNIGRFTLKSLPQDISNSASLWNLLTDVDARIDTELNIVKNMDDWMLDAWNMVELEQKLEKFLQFADKKTPKLKTKKFVIGSEVEFGGSVLTVEKVKNQELIFITPKNQGFQGALSTRKQGGAYLPSNKATRVAGSNPLELVSALLSKI